MENLKIEGYEVQITRLFVVKRGGPGGPIAVGEYTADDKLELVSGALPIELAETIAPELRAAFDRIELEHMALEETAIELARVKAELKTERLALEQASTEVNKLEPMVAELQAQLAGLQLLMGYGESLTDEACSYINPDDVACTQPATRLLVDQNSGARSPACEEHYQAAPENFKVRAVS